MMYVTQNRETQRYLNLDLLHYYTNYTNYTLYYYDSISAFNNIDDISSSEDGDTEKSDFNFDIFFYVPLRFLYN